MFLYWDDPQLPCKFYLLSIRIHLHNDLEHVKVIDGLYVDKICHCSKCEIESNFVSFRYLKREYVVGEIYTHANGNVNQFTNDLSNVLKQISPTSTSIITGGFNIDLIKYNLDNNWDYITKLLNFGYLPYITLPTRINEFSSICIDHRFIKTHKNNNQTSRCLCRNSSLWYHWSPSLLCITVVLNCSKR